MIVIEAGRVRRKPGLKSLDHLPVSVYGWFLIKDILDEKTEIHTIGGVSRSGPRRSGGLVHKCAHGA